MNILFVTYQHIMMQSSLVLGDRGNHAALGKYIEGGTWTVPAWLSVFMARELGQTWSLSTDLTLSVPAIAPLKHDMEPLVNRW